MRNPASGLANTGTGSIDPGEIIRAPPSLPFAQLPPPVSRRRPWASGNVAREGLESVNPPARRGHRRAIRTAGAKLLFLAPYSPDLNPIEQLFAKLKALPRRAAERTVEDAWRRIAQLLDCFSPAECADYITNAGYVSI